MSNGNLVVLALTFTGILMFKVQFLRISVNLGASFYYQKYKYSVYRMTFLLVICIFDKVFLIVSYSICD